MLSIFGFEAQADNMAEASRQLVPALGLRCLTGCYDPVVRYTCRENTFKPALVARAIIQADSKVLDVGCGTGTLTLYVKALHPQTAVMGLDADEEILQIAQQKAAAQDAGVHFVQGFSYDLPLDGSSVDVVLSSLLFHHLCKKDKLRSFQEMIRVLKPGGQVIIADWGKASGCCSRCLFGFIQLLDGFANTNDNVQGLLPSLMEAAGFSDVEETDRFLTMWGYLSIYVGVKPVMIE